MYHFTFLDMNPTDYFGLTLNDLHSLIGEMANSEEWQQTSITLVPGQMHAGTRKLPIWSFPTHTTLFYPFLRVRKTLFPLSLSGLDTLSR